MIHWVVTFPFGASVPPAGCDTADAAYPGVTARPPAMRLSLGPFVCAACTPSLASWPAVRHRAVRAGARPRLAGLAPDPVLDVLDGEGDSTAEPQTADRERELSHA